ncbi:regulatory-associated protein of TOR 2 (RAPTOR2) [Trifolium repens]|nr:regulatory-associated protein of TOR 2 (RAPTOR2) [Trifolium repens]
MNIEYYADNDSEDEGMQVIQKREKNQQKSLRQETTSMPSSGGSHYRRKVISVEATSQLHVGWFAAGFIDGFVRLYDARTPEMAGLELVLDLVCTALGNKFTLHSEEHLLGSRRR